MDNEPFFINVNDEPAIDDYHEGYFVQTRHLPNGVWCDFLKCQSKSDAISHANDLNESYFGKQYESRAVRRVDIEIDLTKGE